MIAPEYYKMPTAAGFILSTFLGVVARRLQVSIVGKNYPRSWTRVTGYALSAGLFTGVYLIADHFIDNNRRLLDRRLALLQEQRAKKDAFFEFEQEPDHRLTASKRGKFFSLFDRYGASYK